MDRLLVDEEEERVRGARAAEAGAAALSVDVHRARQGAAEAAIREAQAIRDIARIGSGVIVAVQAENELEDAPGPGGPTPSIAIERAQAQASAPRPSGNTARRNPTRWPCWPARTPSSGGWSNSRRTDPVPRRPTSIAQKHKVNQARTTVAIAEAAVHAAKAHRDLGEGRLAARPHSGAEREPESLKAAMTRLRQARVDRTRSERDAARLEVNRAEAEAKRDRAAVAFRSKQVERVKQLAARKAVEERLVNEHELALSSPVTSSTRPRPASSPPAPPRGRQGPAQGHRGRGRWE